MARAEDRGKAPAGGALDWRDGVPFSSAHGDPYYALADGLAETRHVFLEGNGLGERFAGARGFRIAELGFGTGLSVLAAWALWRERAAPGAVLAVTSFEARPLAAAEMARAHRRFPALAAFSRALTEAWPDDPAGDVALAFPGLSLRVLVGDARLRLPAWEGAAEAWFLDGFAPARNPEMWEPGLLAAAAARMPPGATLATFTAAGHVRRALAGEGLAVERRPGWGRKRHMTVARRPR